MGKEFGSWLDQRMKIKKLTPVTLGKMIGVSHTSIICWINGTRNPKPGNVAEMAKPLGIDLDEIRAMAGFSGTMPEVRPGQREMLHYYDRLPSHVQDAFTELARQMAESVEGLQNELQAITIGTETECQTYPDSVGNFSPRKESPMKLRK